MAIDGEARGRVDRYRQLFENAPVGIINVDLAGKPLMVNRRAAAGLGYDSPEQFLEEVPSMLDLWADLDQRHKAAEIMLETGSLVDHQVVMRRRDGSWVTLLVSATPVFDEDGKPSGIQVSGIDITDRVEAGRRLAEAQAQAAIGFWSWRLDTDAFAGTNEVFVIAGLDPDEEGSFTRFLDLLHPDDRPVVDERLAAFKGAPGEGVEIEFRLITPGGLTKWVIVRCRVEGDGIQVFGSLQDITKQKLLEERLTELNDMTTEFVGIVAHDLRLPLTVATGYAEFLEEHWDEIGPDERRELLGRLGGSLGRLTDLVSDVLEVSRIESGAATADIAPFDLDAVVTAVAEEIESPDRPLEIHVSLPTDLPPALGDRESVWRVLSNLISNAIKYSPADERIDVAVRVRDRFLEVSVRDRGPGIAPADQSKLFQKFSRVGGGNGKRPPGTGLGLFICRSLVAAFGGSIWVESEPGMGSTFRFTVPIDVANAHGDRFEVEAAAVRTA